MIRNLVLALSLVIVIGIALSAAIYNSLGRLGPSSGGEGYEITARFDNIGNLQQKARVTVGGVRVGEVSGITYDFDSYEAVVSMRIGIEYDRFPLDTAASILTTGLNGEQYIELQPGAEISYLRPGDQIDLTSSALILEQIIGQFLYSMSDGGGEDSAGKGTSSSF